MRPPNPAVDSAPSRVVALLRQQQDRLLAAWARRVLEDPALPDASSLSEPALRDHVPLLVEQVADALARHQGEQEGRSLGQQQASREHAHERFLQHYSLREALRELSHLRAAIVQLCEEEGVPLEGEPARLVHAALDEVMTAAAVEIEEAARNELELERRRLRSTLELLPVGVFIADAQGRLVECNPAAAALWGQGLPLASRVEDYGSYRAFWPGTGRPLAPSEWGLARALRGQASLNEELDILTFDGQPRTILNSALPILDPQGAVVGGVAVNVDVTERARQQRAKAVLSQASAALAASLDYDATLKAVARMMVPQLASYVLVDILEEDGRVARLEVAHSDPDLEEVLRVRQFPPSLASTSPAAQALRSGQARLVPQVTDAWLQSVAQSAEHLELLRALRPSSEMLVPLVARGRTLGLLTFGWAEPERHYDPSDLAFAQELAARAALAIDNTRLFRNAQRALAERDQSLALLDGLIASAPVGIAVVDRELRYQRLNQALADINGLPVEAHLGHTTGELLPDLARVVEPLLRRVRETGEPVLGVEVAAQLPSAPGVTRHWLASYFPIRRGQGELLALGGVVTEITGQKRVAEALARDVALRERFIAILGHDLRNPLTSILLTASALLRHGGLPEPVERALRRITGSAERIERMNHDLLDVTRSHAGAGLPISPGPADLHPICRQVVEELEVAYPDRQIRLALRGQGSGRWDAGRIAQLVSNLVGNALAYSPPDTPVQVEVAEGREEEVLRVHNQGPPIPPEVRATLFDPFRPGRAAPHRSPAGLGLGLYIAREIARAHGGSISVESEPGRGTTFTVRLPTGRPAGEEHAQPGPAFS